MPASNAAKAIRADASPLAPMPAAQTPIVSGFTQFNMPPKLLQALTRNKFTVPTPIQEQAIPLGLAGRDVLGTAQTGTGKTAAFGIPLIARLMASPTAMAVILAPTRELAAQVLQSLAQMNPSPDIKAALLIGGESMGKQLGQLRMRPRLIVGTPGRINDHLARGTLKLGSAGFLVLDEMDRMLDMGFGVQIEKIIAQMPKQRQTLMFSATMAPGIVKVAGKYMHNPERVSVGSLVQATPNVTQELIRLSEEEKYGTLMAKLEQGTGTTIVFVKTKYSSERLAKRLATSHRVDALHGDLRQSKRDRVIQDFRDKKFRVLVATDVAARGLDVPHIELVVNYDLPQAPEDYIHRIGRTARAGASGAAVNLLTPADRDKWNAISRLMNPDYRPAPEDMPRRGGPKPAANGKRGNYGKPAGGYKGPRNDNTRRSPAGGGGRKWAPKGTRD